MKYFKVTIKTTNSISLINSGYPMGCSGLNDGLGFKKPGFDSPFNHEKLTRSAELVKPLLQYLAIKSVLHYS